MGVNDVRAAKSAELRADAQTQRDRASALTALAALINAGDVPVQRWRVYWRGVADECRRQARGANAYAIELDDRATTIDKATTARDEYDHNARAVDVEST